MICSFVSREHNSVVHGLVTHAFGSYVSKSSDSLFLNWLVGPGSHDCEFIFYRVFGLL